MLKILIASSIDPAAIQQLQQNHDVICAFNAGKAQLQEQIRDREVLIFRSGVQITADVMDKAPNLKLILRAGSGVDNIDLDYVYQNNLTLIRIPGPGAKAVAEMAFAMMLNLARNIRQADMLLREGKWAKHEMTGHLLTGKTLGIIGAGNIGARTGELGARWGMNVIGCVEHQSTEATARLLLKGISMVSCEDILAQADFISLHVPLKASTRHMINSEELSKVKPTAFLINLARGGVVDEEALYQALVEGRLAGAALDVHAAEGNGKISPLAGLPNVILTPHIGASTFDSQGEIGEILLEQVEAYIQSQALNEALPRDVTIPVRG